jgi:hypothetical protein
MSGTPSTVSLASSSVVSRAASRAKSSRRSRTVRGDSAWDTAVRARACSGGSASSSRLGGRHGFSLRKSLSPTPAEEQNVAWSRSASWTSAYLAMAHTP